MDAKVDTSQMHVYKHQRRTQMLMTYSDPKGNRVAKVIDMANDANANFVFRVMRWASNHGVEILMRPV